MRAVVRLLLVSLCLIPLGCGNDRSAPATAEPVTTASQPERTTCTQTPPSPFSVEDVAATMGAQGFSLNPVAEPLCTPTSVAFLANIHFRGEHKNVDEHGQVSAREGHLECQVDVRPIRIHDRTYRETTTILSEPGRVWVVRENVICSLYADNRQMPARLSALEEALTDL